MESFKQCYSILHLASHKKKRWGGKQIYKNNNFQSLKNARPKTGKER